MLAEVIRRLQESKMEPTKVVFEEVLKIVKAEVKLGRSPTQELDAEFTPAPAPGWKTFPTKKHAGAASTTPKKATHHHIGDDEFDSPETPQWTGRVPALNGADVTHQGGAVAFMVTTSSRYVYMNSQKPTGHRHAFQRSSSSQHVPPLTNWKRLTRAVLWNHRLMENSSYERLD